MSNYDNLWNVVFPKKALQDIYFLLQTINEGNIKNIIEVKNSKKDKSTIFVKLSLIKYTLR